MKRWYFSLLLFALTVVVFFGGFVSADEIPPWACSSDLTDDSQELFSISGQSNAHAEQWDANNYGQSAETGQEICFWRYFKGSYLGENPHQPTSGNTILRISGATDAHVENLSLDTTGYFDIGYGNLECFLAGPDEDCDTNTGGLDSPYCLIASIYGPTNTHISLTDDDERYAICCKSDNYACICNHDDICQDNLGETPVNCADCETECGDGVIEGLEQCDCGNPAVWDPDNPLVGWDCGDGLGDDLNDTMCVDLGGYVSGTPSCFMPGEGDACQFDEDPWCTKAECNDGIDNDDDGAIDINDFSCWDADGNYNASDNNETLPRPQCNDGIDNDGDTKNNYSLVAGEGDMGCDSFQDNLEANCGDNKQTDPEECDGSDWGGIGDCEDLGYRDGELDCLDSCLFNKTECVGFEGFCIDNEPFLFVQGEIEVAPSSCQDYNLVYPGEENKSMREELCVNDCVPGASDPANNGYGGETLVDWGCAWNDAGDDGGECIFVYNTTGSNPEQQCRLEYDIKQDCTPSNPFRLVEVRGYTWPGEETWSCECDTDPWCTKEIRCPQVIQLPLIGTFGLAMVVLIVTIVYIYINRKK